LCGAAADELSYSNEDSCMHTTKFVYWQDADVWLGYLQEFPDCWSQGETFDDLEEHLRDLYRELTGDVLPGVRKIGDLVIA
jgi:predicted RNase H-like HicB family nuclease